MPARRKIFWSVLFALELFLVEAGEVYSTIEFKIDNSITSADEIEVDISLSGLSSASCNEGKCYLQGLLSAPGQSGYFGFSQNNQNDWYEYVGSPTTDFIQSTFFNFEPEEGSWSGKLKIKNNPSDSDYKGPGEYSLSVKRYTGKSTSSAGESNTLTVQLSYVLPTPIPTSTPSPTTTPTPFSATPTPTSTPTPTPSSTPTPTDQEELIGIVACASTQDQESTQSSNADLFLLNDATESALQSNIIDLTSEQEQIKQTTKNWAFLYSGIGLVGGSVVSFLLKRYNSGLLWPFKRQ